MLIGSGLQALATSDKFKPLVLGQIRAAGDKRHANWISPRRTRALPALARPFSRRFEPLSSGDPVSPA
jgi:hypothetical protein